MTEKGRYKGKKGKTDETHSNEARRDWGADFNGFINFYPTEADKERYVAWVQQVDVWEELDSHANMGRKITVQNDAKGEGAIAMCMERSESSVNAGKICSVRGKNTGVALTRLLYLISGEFPDDWSKSGKMKSDDNW